jgi:predicted DNA-binding protein
MSEPAVTLTIRLPLDTDRRLRAIAARDDRTLSYLVRVAVVRYLNSAERKA